MKMWKMCGTGLVLLAGLTPALRAQIPAVAPAAPAPAAAAGAGGPRNLFSFLCPTPEQKLAFKDKLCKSKIGQLLNQSLRPAGALSGGLVGPFCPGYTQDDLKKPADSAEGAAARVKKDEAEAKARRAAVRYLGTVDCHYWPEAQDALVNALRGDRNECVRWEAALALLNGCCCTRKTVEALAITVSGSEADGNPFETSERVKAAALAALEGCLARLGCPVPLEGMPLAPGAPQIEKPPVEQPPVEKAPGAAAGKPVDPIAYYKRVENIPMEQVVEHARRSAIRHGPAIKALPVAALPVLQPQDSNLPTNIDGSLLGIIMRSINTGKPIEVPVKDSAPPAPSPEPPKQQSAAPQPKRGGDIQPVVHQQPAPAPVTTPGTNRFPMAVPPPPPPKPAAKPQPPVNQKTSMMAPMNQVAMATPAPVPAPAAPAVMPVAWNPLQERQQLAAPPLPAASVQHALRALREAIIPEQREWAAANLATVNWRTEPQVAEALLAAAVKDSAPTVRVACIRSLARMGVNTAPALATIQALKNDPDPRVQTEATRALERLAARQGR